MMGPEPPHFDPAQSQLYDIFATGNTHNRLYHLDFETGSSVVPDLATGFEFREDGTRLMIGIREGVKFHDGSTLTCADVKYSFDRILTPPAGMKAQRGGLYQPNIHSIDCPNDTTVQFNLNGPWAEALIQIGDTFALIYPKGPTEAADKAGDYLKLTETIDWGTGPFKVKSHTPGDSTVLEPFDEYWNQPYPYLDGVTVLWREHDYRAYTTAFQAGRIDYFMANDSPPMYNELVDQSNGRWTAAKGPTAIVGAFVPDMKGDSIWNDHEVRKAAALALVQDEYIPILCDVAFACFFGGVLPTPPANPYGLTEEEVRSVPGYGRDVEGRRAEARRIVEAHGLVGHKFTMHTWATFPFTNDTSIWACEALNKVGFDCNVQGYEAGPYYTMVNNQNMPVGDATAMGMGGPWPVGAVDQSLGQFWIPEGIRNYGKYEDPYLSELMVKQSSEMDFETRKEILREFQFYALEKYYHVALGWRGVSRAWWNHINGPGFVAPGPSMTTWPTKFEATWISPS
jgi:peptide/nickel transport system substrate-binding protein